MLVLQVIDGVVRVANDGTPLVTVVRVYQQLDDLYERLINIAEDAAQQLSVGSRSGVT